MLLTDWKAVAEVMFKNKPWRATYYQEDDYDNGQMGKWLEIKQDLSKLVHSDYVEDFMDICDTGHSEDS